MESTEKEVGSEEKHQGVFSDTCPENQRKLSSKILRCGILVECQRRQKYISQHTCTMQWVPQEAKMFLYARNDWNKLLGYVLRYMK